MKIYYYHSFQIFPCLLSTKLIRVNRQLLHFSHDAEGHDDAFDEQLPRQRDLRRHLPGLARVPAGKLARPERPQRPERPRHLRRTRIRSGSQPAAQQHPGGDEQGENNS